MIKRELFATVIQFRSSHWRFFAEYFHSTTSDHHVLYRNRCSAKVLLKFSQNSRKKHLRQSAFLIQLQADAILLKKRLQPRGFPLHFRKFLRELFLQNTSTGCFCVSDHHQICRLSYDILNLQILTCKRFVLGRKRNSFDTFINKYKL